jgi:hypothetical protein
MKFVGLILLTSLVLCCWIAIEAHNLLRDKFDFNYYTYL